MNILIKKETTKRTDVQLKYNSIYEIIYNYISEVKMIKNILLTILLLLIIGSGVVFAFSALSNKQETKGDSIMDKKVLVAYFSATGTIKNVAQKLAKAFDSDIYEIEPKNPYTKADLDWTDKNSRSSVEMNNRNSRPEIKKDDFSVSDYDVIFLGFPIWWGSAPTVVNTFLEQHDFSNKKIILFATSGGSAIEGTAKGLKDSVSKTTEIIEGKLFNYSPNEEELKKWIEEIL